MPCLYQAFGYLAGIFSIMREFLRKAYVIVAYVDLRFRLCLFGFEKKIVLKKSDDFHQKYGEQNILGWKNRQE